MRILREPLLHFFVLGALVFAAARHFDGDSNRYRIDAGPEQRARLEATYRQQYGSPPTATQLQYLLDQYVRSEILFREGLAMGLDREDEIVRRRVVQKIEFVNQDLNAEEQPSETALTQFYESHKPRYNSPATATFSQLYFSTDHGGDAAAKARAEKALALLERGDSKRALASTDPFVDGENFVDVSRANAASLFGDSAFTAALFTAPTEQWAGPFKSGYGWHLVRVSGRQESRPADLASVKSRVQSDYLADARERRNNEEFRRLASKYTIVTSRAPT